MNKMEIVQRLLSLPREIQVAEGDVIGNQLRVQRAKDALENKRAQLLLGQIDGIVIDGKNAEQREAQLRQYTETKRNDLAMAESALAEERLTLGKLRNELDALKSVARILDNEGAA